mmetsp:Transcript_20232/g.44124  ORF Transcript_20232/g.44124 Transcript_20232/m.44124 type:complete len:240 (+) Transcript_20232:999-1718(+)
MMPSLVSPPLYSSVPITSSRPDMVKVLPDPVCPYANTVTLYPDSAASSSWGTPHRCSTSAWEVSGPRQAWKAKSRCILLPAGPGTMILTMVWSSVTCSTDEAPLSVSGGNKGLTLTATLMLSASLSVVPPCVIVPARSVPNIGVMVPLRSAVSRTVPEVMFRVAWDVCWRFAWLVGILLGGGIVGVKSRGCCCALVPGPNVDPFSSGDRLDLPRGEAENVDIILGFCCAGSVSSPLSAV